MWTIWRQFVVLKFRELYAALIQKLSWRYFSCFCQEWRLQNIREIVTSMSHFDVMFLTFVFSLLLPVLQMGLCYGSLWLKKSDMLREKILNCWELAAQVLLMQRLPVSCHMPGAWLGLGDIFFISLLGVSARVTVPTAQPAELILLCKSCPALVQVKQGSLSSNVTEALELPLLGVKLLNLYFGSWYTFFNVGLINSHTRWIWKASILHC